MSSGNLVNFLVRATTALKGIELPTRCTGSRTCKVVSFSPIKSSCKRPWLLSLLMVIHGACSSLTGE